MRLIITMLLLSMLSTDPGKIGEVNTAKSEARKAYVSGDYKKALERYRYLTDSLEVDEDEVALNLANTYYQLKDTANASAIYQSLVGSEKNEIRSKAHHQLGVLEHKQGKLEEALNNFKQAIKADANNIDARYNYEMLKKKLDEQKKKQEQNKKDNEQKSNDKQNKDQKSKEQEKKEDEQKKDQQKKDQEQKDQQQKDEQQKKEQQEKDQQSKDQQSKDEKDKKEKDQKQNEQKDKENKEKNDASPQLSEKLQQMKISEEKAKMILEAMKNQEIQYLQQNKRKATKAKDKNKPDW